MECPFKKLAAGLILFCLSPLAAEQIQPIGPFSGLNNTDNPLIIKAEEAQDLLNVDITPGGKSFKKRKGYGLQFTLAMSTAPTHGIYNFYDANGNDVSLFFHDRFLQVSIGGATTTTLFSTATAGGTWQCADSLGIAYCASSNREPVIRTNGITATPLLNAPTGYIVAVTPERLLIAGTAANPQRISFSKANDFTTWTVGGEPTDPNFEEITAPGSKITHVTYAFGRIIWFKDASFGAILGTNNNNWQVITISPNLGTLDNTSVYWDGMLYFRGQDGHIYEFDGSSARKMTRALTTTVLESATRRSNQWTQSSQADFQAGSIVPTNSLNLTTTPGAVFRSSVSFVDTSSANFAAGSLLKVDTTTVDGSVNLKHYMADTFANFSNWTNENCSGCGTMSASGGKAVCTGSACMAVSSMTVSADFGISFNFAPPSASGSGIVAGLNNSRAGYAVRINPALGSVELMEFTDFNDLSASVLCTSSTFSMAGQSPVFLLIRNSATNALTLYKDGVEICSATDATVTSFTNVRMYLSGTPTFDNFYNIERTGNLTSRIFDTAFSTPIYGTFVSTTSGNGTIAFGVRCSSNSANSYTSDSSITPGSFISTCSHKRYLVYTATMTVGTNAVFPQISEVTTLAASTGTFYSQVKNAPSLTSFDTFGTGQTTSGTGAISWFTRTSTNTFTVLSATPTWVAQSAGGTVSASTGTFFQVRADFGLTVATDTVQIDDFTVNWFEGTASDKAYGIYFDNAIWWTIASGDGVTGNNYVMRYDLINQAWTLYDIGINGMLVRNQALYFGSSSAGKVFKFGDVTNDNGSAINAYWKSKDFFGISPFTTNEFRSLSLSAASISNSSMTITYTVNGSSSAAYTVYSYDANSNFLRNNKNLPLGKVGSYFNVKVGNNAADQPFEVFGMQFTYEPKPWMPTP